MYKYLYFAQLAPIMLHKKCFNIKIFSFSIIFLISLVEWETEIAKTFAKQ